MDAILIIFWGVVLLSLLVVIHEFGHFLVARLCGVRVTEFMIGMPGPSIGFTRRGTRFGLTCIPLGGYARVCGMETGPEEPLLAPALAYVWRQGSTDAEHLAAALNVDEADAANILVILSGWGSITTPKGSLTDKTYLAPARPGFAKGEAREVADEKAALDEERKGTYRSLPFRKRLYILFAGPLFNLLSAVLVFVILLSVHGVYNNDTSINDVIDGRPAAVAGLTPGDVIVSLDDTTVESWGELKAAIDSYSPGDTAMLGYTTGEGGERHDVSVTFDTADDGGAALGFYPGQHLERMSLPDSLSYTFDYIGQVLIAIGKLFWPTTAAETISQSTSVVGIAFIAKDAASAGALSFVAIAAALSVSLGLMNLLPIPPLDGGRIVIEIGQKITRRDATVRLVNALTMIGIAIVGILFVVLLWQDISRFILGG